MHGEEPAAVSGRCVMSVTCNGWMRPNPAPIPPHEPIPSGIQFRALLREWRRRLPMDVWIRGWTRRAHDTDNWDPCGAYTLIGWYWYRSGSWNSRYGDGSRLFYVHVGP